MTNKNTYIANLLQFEVARVLSMHNEMTEDKWHETEIRLRRDIKAFCPCVVNGIEFNTIKDVCIHFNLTYLVVHHRFKSHKWGKWRCSQITKLVGPYTVYVDDVMYTNRRTVAKAFGLTPVQTVTRFQSPRWPTWVDPKLPKNEMPQYDKKARGVIIEGVAYPSLTAAAKTLKINSSIVFSRVNSRSDKYKGWNYEQSGVGEVSE